FRMTSAAPSLRWLEDNAAGMQVEITDVSDDTAALSLQGPMAWSILESLGARPLTYFRIAAATLRGIPVTISRTGYTGELGYAIWVDARQALPLWDPRLDPGRGNGII